MTEMQDFSSWLQRKMPDVIAESPDSRAWFESSPSAPLDVSDKYINIAGVIPPVWNLEPPLCIDGDVVMRNGQEADLQGGTADPLNENGALSDNRMDVDRGEGRGGGMLEDSVSAMMQAGENGQGRIQESDAQMDGGQMGTGNMSDARMDPNEMGNGSRDEEGEGGAQGDPGSLSHHGRSDGRNEGGEDEATDGSGTQPGPKPASKPKPGKARGKNGGTKEKLPMKKGRRESRSDAKAGLSKQSAIDVDAFFVSEISHALFPPHPFYPRMYIKSPWHTKHGLWYALLNLLPVMAQSANTLPAPAFCRNMAVIGPSSPMDPTARNFPSHSPHT